MFRHISLFTLKSQPENGKTQKENRAILLKMLRELPESDPTILNNVVGDGLGGPPDLPPGGPQFCHVAQIIDFATMEDCMAYPASQGHLALTEFGQGVIESVACMDFEL